MSMRDYAVYDYGMVLEDEVGEMICKALDHKFDASEHSWEYFLYNEGIGDYISEFTGEAIPITDDGNDNWGSAYTYDYSADVIFYISLGEVPCLFRQVYNNMEEVVDELKNRIGKYLPDDFDYRSRIRHIVGTYYG